VAERWRRLHNEELHNLYTSPNIIRVNNEGGYDGRSMWNVCEREMYALFWLENVKGRDH